MEKSTKFKGAKTVAHISTPKKDLRNHKFQVHARRKSKKDDPFAAIEDAEFVLA